MLFIYFAVNYTAIGCSRQCRGSKLFTFIFLSFHYFSSFVDNSDELNTSLYSLVDSHILYWPLLSDNFLADISYVLSLMHKQNINLQSKLGEIIIIYTILLNYQHAAATVVSYIIYIDTTRECLILYIIVSVIFVK